MKTGCLLLVLALCGCDQGHAPGNDGLQQALWNKRRPSLLRTTDIGGQAISEIAIPSLEFQKDPGFDIICYVLSGKTVLFCQDTFGIVKAEGVASPYQD